MAQVTIVTERQNNVNGNTRENFYVVNIATSGDTLVTPLSVIYSVSVNDGAITKSSPSGGTITFTTTGAVTGALVKVQGE